MTTAHTTGGPPAPGAANFPAVARAALDQLLTAHGQRLAAISWQAYCAGGRGCLFTAPGSSSLYFVEAQIIPVFPASPTVREQILAEVRAYDPQREVVLVIEALTPADLYTPVWLVIRYRPPRSPQQCFLARAGTPGFPVLHRVSALLNPKGEGAEGSVNER